MLQSAISRISCICRRQKAVREMKFGECQNQLNDLISTGVDYISSSPSGRIHNVQSEIAFENSDNDYISVEAADDNNNNNEDEHNEIERKKELDIEELDVEAEEIDESSDNDYEGSTDDERSEITENKAVADRADEYVPPEVENVTRTRSGGISRPCDYAKHFLETAHFQSNLKGIWIKILFCNSDEMVDKLGYGIYYKESYFTFNIKVTKIKDTDLDMK